MPLPIDSCFSLFLIDFNGIEQGNALLNNWGSFGGFVTLFKNCWSLAKKGRSIAIPSEGGVDPKSSFRFYVEKGRSITGVNFSMRLAKTAKLILENTSNPDVTQHPNGPHQFVVLLVPVFTI